MTPFLEVKELRVRYGSGRRAVVALDGISFVQHRDRPLGVVGLSGSGKSTLARVLVGLARPAAGSVRFDGTSLDRQLGRPGALADRIQMVFQDARGALDPRLSIGESLQLALPGRTPDPEAVAAALEEVELDPGLAERRPGRLSGGERQRVTIARALLRRPELLILDEAVSSLDLSLRAQILELLERLRRSRSLQLLCIAHELTTVEALCDELLVFERGRIVERGSCATLLANPEHPCTRALVEAAHLGDPRQKR